MPGNAAAAAMFDVLVVADFVQERRKTNRADSSDCNTGLGQPVILQKSNKEQMLSNGDCQKYFDSLVRQNVNSVKA
jgi:hypothetical protein